MVLIAEDQGLCLLCLCMVLIADGAFTPEQDNDKTNLCISIIKA